VTFQPPSFDDLVGNDLDARERDRLHRVHELLLAAGPPPDFTSEHDVPEATATVHVLPRRRRGMLVGLAAALGVLVFAVGFLAGVRSDDPGTFEVVVMEGVGTAQDASATLEIFDVDELGNWPMEIEARGLRPSSSTGRLYELWLTKDGRLAAPCGRFFAEDDGLTVVPLNAPYRFDDYDAWVVVEQGSDAPLLTT
jgi:hypothetical protein